MFVLVCRLLAAAGRWFPVSRSHLFFPPALPLPLSLVRIVVVCLFVCFFPILHTTYLHKYIAIVIRPSRWRFPTYVSPSPPGQPNATVMTLASLVSLLFLDHVVVVVVVIFYLLRLLLEEDGRIIIKIQIFIAVCRRERVAVFSLLKVDIILWSFRIYLPAAGDPWAINQRESQSTAHPHKLITEE